MHDAQSTAQYTGPGPGRESLRIAFESYRPGYALPRTFYKDPAIFQLDMRHFAMAHWHCVGHASMVPHPGDYFVVELAGESVVILRGADHEIRALLNVCRHRGSRVCTEKAGTAKNGLLVCPYHAWTYGLSGELVRARMTPEAFNKDDFGLKRVPLSICEGVLFITFAENPLGFANVEASFGHAARIYGWSRAKVGARRHYLISANWKLVTENYQECYHCGPAHQEYARRHVFARPEAQREAPDLAMHERDAVLGLPLADIDYYAADAQPGQESADCWRSALIDGYVTGSRDGKPLAPLMGEFRGKTYDGGLSFLDVGPTSNFLAYPDYGLIYRTIPLSVDQTGFELIWLVDADAIAGQDYREEDLVWMWDYTSVEDKKIIELNQAGVNSAFFEPGPYTPMETDACRYVDWYIAAMREVLEGGK
ncbi:MAG: aromatic ring-hydroxylating dioxygenase subunit alpha [Burkholderiaceae bacterium]|jgi:Rieske 2Fe-2S family protein